MDGLEITGGLKFQERMIMEEVWWFCDERGLCVGNTYFKHKFS